MKEIITYILLGVFLLILILILQVNSKKYYQDLADLLYNKKDPHSFLKKLDSRAGKFFIDKKKRLFTSIDAYIMMNDKKKVKDIFTQLENMKLSYGSKIGLYQKEVQYYVQIKENDKALKANSLLQEQGSKINDKNMKKILDEANELIEIYVNKNPNYDKVMLEKYDNESNQMLKGIYAYRLAKCYFYKNDKKNVEKYLKDCRNKCKGSYWAKLADECLKDFNKLLDN